MNEPLSFLLVGAGGIAQSYVQALRSTPLGRLSAAVDIRPAAAAAACEGTSGRAFTSLEGALREMKPDAAIVCTPPSTHADIAVRLLQHGVHVLCEKPLALDLGNAERMVTAASSARRLLTMGSKFRYVADVVEAQRIAASGSLGDIILFENTFTSRVDMSGRWNADPLVAGGGVLIDNGTHSVDLVRYFLGPITEIQAVEGKRVQTPHVEDTARLFVRSVEGVVANVDLSWTLHKERDSYIDVYGSSGVLRVGWKESKHRSYASPAWTVFGKGYDKLTAFRAQVENFCRAIRGEESLLITSEDALASVQVIDAAYQSLRRNVWVRVGGVKNAA
ncbi:MAG TPA: Gfo/Idh/MocA family oxidoreductase [Anaeromyxobacteraceae bacterium]|nr:Gfo/Idh/MocA family oxidoreductase [Anaeromyxobacteraceae bacterium]